MSLASRKILTVLQEHPAVQVARLLKSIGLTPDEVEIATWPSTLGQPD